MCQSWHPPTYCSHPSLARIRRKRPSLRLIVSSATLDATAFLDYFTASTSPDEATIVSLEGRMFPVEVAYLQEPTPDYVQKAAQVCWNINLQQGPGDVLVFLTGREEIEQCLENLAEMIPTYVHVYAHCCTSAFKPSETAFHAAPLVWYPWPSTQGCRQMNS
jgi:HrpA-like RNA helicase